MHNHLAEAIYIDANLSEMKNRLSVVEQKIFIYAIQQIDQETEHFEEVHLYLSELAKITGIDTDSLLKRSNDRFKTMNIEEHVRRIMSIVINTWDVNEKGKRRLRTYNLTSKAEYVEGQAFIRFKFNSEMMLLLLQLQEYYFIQAPQVIQFSSVHSIRIYDYFKAKTYNSSFLNTTIKEFKELFGLEKNIQHSKI